MTASRELGIDPRERWAGTGKSRELSDLVPSAESLKQSRESCLKTALETIGRDIKEKESRGARSTYYYLKPNDPADMIIEYLFAKGFKANIENDPDPRDRDIKYIKIVWN